MDPRVIGDSNIARGDAQRENPNRREESKMPPGEMEFRINQPFTSLDDMFERIHIPLQPGWQKDRRWQEGEGDESESEEEDEELEREFFGPGEEDEDEEDATLVTTSPTRLCNPCLACEGHSHAT
jgi:hypothetical protein